MSKIKDPSAKKTKKKFPLHPFELVWYPLCGLVGIWGIVYIVLGLVALNLPVAAEDGDLVKANAKIAKTFGLDFFGWGLIILAIAAVAIVVALLLFSNKVDREYEKTVRRAQRMAQLEAEVDKEEGVIDAEVEPVQPKEEPEADEEPEELKEEAPEEEPEELKEEQPEEKPAEEEEEVSEEQPVEEPKKEEEKAE